MFGKIAVTLDGSETSEIALPYAQEIAKNFNSDLSVVGVFNDQKSPLVRIYKKYFTDIVAKINESDIQSRPVFLFGKAADEILNYTRKENVNLLVMATKGRSSSKEWAIGSVAEKIIKGVAIPLLLIPFKQRDINQKQEVTFKRILVPLDGSDAGEAVLPKVKELAKKSNAQIILLYAIAYKITGSLDFNIHFQEQLISILHGQAKEYMASIAAQLETEKINFTYEIIHGEVSPTIIEYASKNSVDLIALSSHGRHDMGIFAIGSTPDKVIHTTNIPILLVRSPRKQRPDTK